MSQTSQMVWLPFSLVVVMAGVAIAADAIPRLEHPRPQMERSEWLNLNGEWQFAETDDDISFLETETYPDRIIVPFCRESKLSGLARKGFVKNVWYKRTFTVPSQWNTPRVRLHVGACDWRTTVWVNGIKVGEHIGGSAPFAFEVTDALKDGENVVVIHVFDDTRSTLQSCGKQSQQEESYGCVYTRTTGIWQTVWLEGIGSSFVSQYSLVPDPVNNRVLLQVEVDGPSRGVTVEAEALWKGNSVGKASSIAAWRNNQLVLDLSETHLWSVQEPNLYDLRIKLARDGKILDALNGYFGLRTIEIEGQAITINGEPVFQRLVLDQGFYPDGIWTAPNEAALKKDIELSQAVGFNGARLHQKVFEPRFLYWADRLGYLVWGEYPNWGLDYKKKEINVPVLKEWEEILRRDRNHPSIIGWCPFNETPGDAGELQSAIVAITRSIDPTRPVLESSGYAHTIADPEVLDAHDYNQDPVSFKQKWDGIFMGGADLPSRYGAMEKIIVPFFVSEYGGIGWFPADAPAWGYGNSPKTLDEFYERYAGLTNAQLDNRYLYGFCYTQLTDIEQERNGIYYYDRTPKFDAAKLKAINSRKAAYEIDPPFQVDRSTQAGDPWTVLVGAEPDMGKASAWRYQMEDNPGVDWMKPDFADSAWKSGKAGFGAKGGWEKRIHTPWSGKDIWLRQEFEFDGSTFSRAMLVLHYDNATEVYVNGVDIWRGTGWNDSYQGFDVTDALRQALKTGKNVIAIHCHQDDGGQFIDAALLVNSH